MKTNEKYIVEFERKYKVKLDFTKGNSLFFGDEIYDIDQVKYMVDNNIKYKYLYDYNWFMVEYAYNRLELSLHEYCEQRKKHESEIENFDLHNFEKLLLCNEIDKLLKF